jgi:hypothetical protein
MATLMLENGADIRACGLENNSNLHTRRDPTLQEIHRATHPANLEHDKRTLRDASAAEDDEK